MDGGGDFQNPGIIPRAIDRIFDNIGKSSADNQFEVSIYYIEIYNEKVRDLLNPLQDNMKVRESAKDGFIVQDVTENFCTDRESVMRLITLGKTNRACAPVSGW